MQAHGAPSGWCKACTPAPPRVPDELNPVTQCHARDTNPNDERLALLPSVNEVKDVSDATETMDTVTRLCLRIASELVLQAQRIDKNDKNARRGIEVHLSWLHGVTTKQVSAICNALRVRGFSVLLPRGMRQSIGIYWRSRN